MLCPSCFIREATQHPSLGVLPCTECQARMNKLPAPRHTVEIIPERIKTERQERGDSIIQPHIKGELDKRYIDLWGEGAARERGFTEKEIKNAKYVADGTPAGNYYKDRT